ncbi:MAG TPA: benzoate-CoA ligase family protein [Candidatus Acidoferrales bacterium]|nr:benzoate-CoA ligase family protein [Candidatus Acidoferrales bacterium]
MTAADYFLNRHVREGRGNRIAIAGVGPPLTYEELADRTARAAAAWLELGVQPGDRVLLILPDSPELLACFFGTMKMGGIAVPVNPFTRATDYAYYAADCRPRLAVVHEWALAEALPALQQSEEPPRILTVGAKAPASELLDDALSSVSPLHEARSLPAQAGPLPDDVAFFLYTSGSGGQPKAAMHRHRHLLATADSYARQVLGIRPDDVAFSASKLFFAYGLGNAGYFPLSVGAATVLFPERPTAEKLFAVLEQHRPTLFFAVPTLYGAMLRAAEGTSHRFDFLRAAVSAGEALPVEIFERFKARFGLEILDGIGTTEMLHMFISNRPGEARPGSCGREVPGYKARIVTDSGDEAKAGEIGNLWVSGASRMAGYWEKPDLDARVLRDEWYLTGDQFYRDPDGFFHYCGRADDMLKVSGMWVSPLEVENALLAHAAVAEAAVVGRRDPDGLTQIVAHIVLAGAGHADPTNELRTFLRQRLPGYKVPQRFEFVPDLPKTATGKIQRFKLRS